MGWTSLRYVRRLLAIGITALVGLLAVRWYLVPEGFGETGHYRAAAPVEEAAREPLLRGKAVCGGCHADEFAKHEKDVHVTVECEDCHGAGAEHVEARLAGKPKGEGVIFRELAQANCLACHRRIEARPKLFPTIDLAEHFALVGVKDAMTPCQGCHNPHEPLFLERRVVDARIHPLIHRCTDCHAQREVQSRPLPEGHVVTFQCRDCHADVVADYQSKTHHALDCTTCHPFRKDSEFSGRILKIGSPTFCLMCHQKRSFMDPARKPLIESLDAHIAEYGSPDDKGKRCVDCHLEDNIHARRKAVPPAAKTDGGQG